MKLLIRYFSTKHNGVFKTLFTQHTWVEKFLVAIFCFVFPFGTREALWEFGIYPPYTTVFLYATDVVMAALLVWWIFAAKTRTQQSLRETLRDWNVPLPVLAFLALLGIGIISALQSGSPLLGFATLARLALFALFAFFLAVRKPPMLHASCFMLPLLFSGIFQALLGIYQFVTQRSFGFALFGEQILGKNITGVAKIEVLGEKLVRAYGTLPHPNILAAFLVLAIFFSITVFISAHRHTSISQNIWWTALWQAGIALMLVALFFTFSRSGWLAFGGGIIAFLIWLFMRRDALLPDEKQRLAALGISMAGVALFAGLYFRNEIKSRAEIPELQDQAVQLRLSGAYWAAQMIDANRYFGVGPGQFVPNIKQYTGELPEPWVYQPVHNMYALVAAEFGILGLMAFLLFTWAAGRLLFIRSKDVSVLYAATASAIFFAVLVLGFFDHYLFAFEQGMGVFWVSIALVLSTKNSRIVIQK